MAIFYPRKHFISNITNAQYAVVTFTEPHTFIVNEIISLRVSQPYGMVQLNYKQVKVIATDTEEVTLDIDSTNFTPFEVPLDLTGTTPPMAVPSSSGVDNSTPIAHNILEDAFDHRPN